MILRLTGGAEGAQRAAVEAIHHGDDFVPSRFPVEPGQLDCCFDRLRTAIAEKALAAPSGSLAQCLREPALLLRVPGVRDVNQPTDLLSNGGDHAWRTMTDQVAAP